MFGLNESFYKLFTYFNNKMGIVLSPYTPHTYPMWHILIGRDSPRSMALSNCRQPLERSNSNVKYYSEGKLRFFKLKRLI